MLPSRTPVVCPRYASDGHLEATWLDGRESQTRDINNWCSLLPQLCCLCCPETLKQRLLSAQVLSWLCKIVASRGQLVRIGWSYNSIWCSQSVAWTLLCPENPASPLRPACLSNVHSWLLSKCLDFCSRIGRTLTPCPNGTVSQETGALFRDTPRCCWENLELWCRHLFT